MYCHDTQDSTSACERSTSQHGWLRPIRSLPSAALPADWPRPEARRIFEAIHDATAPIVAAYIRTALAEVAPEAAAAARALSVSEALDLYATADIVDRSHELDLASLGPSVSGTALGARG